MTSDCEPVIDEILKKGDRLADETEVFFSSGEGTGLDLKGKLIGEAFGSGSWGIGIRVIKDGKIGCSSTNDPKCWEKCLISALDSAKLSSPQNWEGLPSDSLLPDVKLDVYDKDLSCDISSATALIERMLDGASEYESIIVGGGASLSAGRTVIANSNGVFYSIEKTGAGISLETIFGTSTGYEFDSSAYTKRLNPEKTGREASSLAVFSKDGCDIKTGIYDVILSPVAVCQLLSSVLIPSLSGRNVKAKRSFFDGKLGQKCFDENFSLYDDPFSGMGATLRDSEGVPTRRIDFIKSGIVEEFSYDLKTAYRYNEKSTGSAVRDGAGGAPVIGTHNICVDGKRENIFDEKAVYAHTVVGAHTANAVTGDFSVELSNAAFVEGGEKEKPIKSAMLSGNVFEMLNSVSGMSEETRSLGSMTVPSVRFSGLSVVGRL
ncbi:PmbA protein [Methanomicrobium sp. W14]|uniref:TldD/PmbA family protein n=1 Tax=Methanomicrobium sp. W14 TaxID=2817839 RepID=UPI001AE75A22|nr:metallopeptidase TldD-related protein [Methanomicrobium sp. W14]MBP2133603.1 PmbA protein [Methanomicrobium sp. W14]